MMDWLAFAIWFFWPILAIAGVALVWAIVEKVKELSIGAVKK